MRKKTWFYPLGSDWLVKSGCYFRRDLFFFFCHLMDIFLSRLYHNNGNFTQYTHFSQNFCPSKCIISQAHHKQTNKIAYRTVLVQQAHHYHNKGETNWMLMEITTQNLVWTANWNSNWLKSTKPLSIVWFRAIASIITY